jgi:glycosyltransferase involved in cell wall biosynthesis
LPAEFKEPEAIVFVWVGRHEAVKDPLLATRAFVRLREIATRPERMRLIMLGSGSLESEVRAILDAAGASGAAWLPGARDDVAALLNASDVYLMSSLNEGISNTILEAMASQLPVIATEVGGNPELVVDSVCGFLTPAGDVERLARAMERYALDPALREAHGRAARERVMQNFTLAVMVERYLELYDATLCGRR